MRATVVGAGGMLGAALVTAFTRRGHDVVGMSRRELDLEDPGSVTRALVSPGDVVVNAAAWTDVDGCALDPVRAERINGRGAGLVADAAARGAALTIQVSTNEVFDGRPGRAYAEDDAPNPLNAYGASKLAGERAVATAGPHLIARTAWLFDDRRGFPARIAAAAVRARAGGVPLRVVADEFGNPTWVPDAADAIVRLAELRLGHDEPRVVHVAGEPPVSRFEWARWVLPPGEPPSIEPIASTDYARPSRVPLHAVLATGLARRLGIPASDWRTHAAETSAGARSSRDPGR